MLVLILSFNQVKFYHLTMSHIHYTRGSQPVVRVPLVVRGEASGGTQKVSVSSKVKS
jgi:hypothetical protein